MDHRVCWNSHFEFECKLTATLSTGTLDACTCRVSVRRVNRFICGINWNDIRNYEKLIKNFLGH